MAETKNGVFLTKGKGSQQLLASLQHGDVQLIADAFGYSHTKCYNWINGKHYGDLRVVKCAQELAAFYQNIQLQEKRINIINNHGKAN